MLSQSSVDDDEPNSKKPCFPPNGSSEDGTEQKFDHTNVPAVASAFVKSDSSDGQQSAAVYNSVAQKLMVHNSAIIWVLPAPGNFELSYKIIPFTWNAYVSAEFCSIQFWLVIFMLKLVHFRVDNISMDIFFSTNRTLTCV